MRKGIGLLCLVMFAAGCGGQPEFKEFSPPGGNLKVLLPGTPKNESQDHQGMKVNSWSASVGKGQYTVGFVELPIPKGEDETKIQNRLDGAVQGMVGNVRAELVDSKKISLQNKYPGREVVANLPEGKGVIHARLYLVGTRLYQTMAVGTKTWVAGADTNKFLNSLKITQ